MIYLNKVTDWFKESYQQLPEMRSFPKVGKAFEKCLDAYMDKVDDLVVSFHDSRYNFADLSYTTTEKIIHTATSVLFAAATLPLGTFGLALRIGALSALVFEVAQREKNEYEDLLLMSVCVMSPISMVGIFYAGSNSLTATMLNVIGAAYFAISIPEIGKLVQSIID